MSWTQGIQLRNTLPSRFLAFADAQGEKRGWGNLDCIVWDAAEPDIVFLDYGERGSLKLDLAGLE